MASAWGQSWGSAWGDAWGIIAQQTGGGIGHGQKKRHIWIEEDGKILVFRSPSDAANYLAKAKPERTTRTPVRRTPEPLVIDLPQIRRFAPLLNLEFETPITHATDGNIDLLIELGRRLARWEEEETLALLLVL